MRTILAIAMLLAVSGGVPAQSALPVAGPAEKQVQNQVQKQVQKQVQQQVVQRVGVKLHPPVTALVKVGKRDPFLSPVVTQSGRPGCSAGKKYLEIGQISVKGVVRSTAGFTAVVTDGLNRTYFLREKDAVFHGGVLKITADSVVFRLSQPDRLGKMITQEVVKKISTPAV